MLTQQEKDILYILVEKGQTAFSQIYIVGTEMGLKIRRGYIQTTLNALLRRKLIIGHQKGRNYYLTATEAGRKQVLGNEADALES